MRPNCQHHTTGGSPAAVTRLGFSSQVEPRLVTLDMTVTLATRYKVLSTSASAPSRPGLSAPTTEQESKVPPGERPASIQPSTPCSDPQEAGILRTWVLPAHRWGSPSRGHFPFKGPACRAAPGFCMSVRLGLEAHPYCGATLLSNLL